ncbi:MAG: HAD family hydrolase [Acidobacteria bacterium]|nr:MAG: HAD family hydrolase [Acidobacteriota bacterium]
MPSPAVFLDKDGTLIHDVPYNVDPALICFTPGAAEGLRLLHERGFRLVVVSNQSGVAKGFFPEEALTTVEARLRELCAKAGVSLAGFYYCPHSPDARVKRYATTCFCRKPRPGLLVRAALDLDLDPKASWLIGDILDDIEAGTSAGCKTVLLLNGNETEWELSSGRCPQYYAADLKEAAQVVIGQNLRNRVFARPGFVSKGDAR